MNDNPDAETVFEFEIGKSMVSTTVFSLTNSKFTSIYYLVVTFIIIFLSIQIQVKTGANYKFDNSANLAYEADHVRDCLLEGRLESPKITLNETILIAELMETVRKQVGVSYEQDQRFSLGSVRTHIMDNYYKT